MAARSGNNDNNGSIVEINVIPLVDIILVVLIIFMVAAPLVMQPKIDINLPKSTSSKDDIEKNKKPLRVVLGKQGEVFLNNIPITVEGLQEESQKMVASNPETAALLVADKDATLEMVTELVDAVKNGGIKKVAFSIQKN